MGLMNKIKSLFGGSKEKTDISFSVTMPKEKMGKGHYRTQVAGLMVRHPKLGDLKVLDISAVGISFKFPFKRIKAGVKIKVDLVLKKKVVCKKLRVEIMRHEKSMVGCQFVDMTRVQDETVHKLALLGQKQQAEKRRRQRLNEPMNLD